MPLSLLNEHIVVIDVYVDFIYIDYNVENGYDDDWNILKKISEKVIYLEYFNSMQVTNNNAALFYCLLRSDRIVYKGYNAYS